jgi:hypothetical protein
LQAAFHGETLHIADIHPARMDHADPATGRTVYASNLLSWALDRMAVRVEQVREVRYYCIQDKHFTKEDLLEMHSSEQTDWSAELAGLTVGIVAAARRAFPAITRIVLGGPSRGSLHLGILLSSFMSDINMF